MHQLSLDLYRFFRLSAVGATAVLPLLGAASSDGALCGRQAVRLLGVAAAFHAFAYIHNDLCDLELDRTQPLRAAYPLVRGSVSPQAAGALALACVPLAFTLSEQPTGQRSPWVARGYLGAAFALLAAYNRWGKRCPLPPLTDLVQALGWAALLKYGATWVGRPTRLTTLLSTYEVLLIMLVNGVHGGLRDLKNDRAAGAQTTAILLGAEERAGKLSVPPILLLYALSLQAALLALPLWAACANLADQPAQQRKAALIGVGSLSLLTLALLWAAARSEARPADIGMLHLILILSMPLALVAPGMAPAPRAALLLAHSLPLLINGMTYDALRWALAWPQAH